MLVIIALGASKWQISHTGKPSELSWGHFEIKPLNTFECSFVRSRELSRSCVMCFDEVASQILQTFADGFITTSCPERCDVSVSQWGIFGVLVRITWSLWKYSAEMQPRGLFIRGQALYQYTMIMMISSNAFPSFMTFFHWMYAILACFTRCSE